jgi:hypothetical protein
MRFFLVRRGGDALLVRVRDVWNQAEPRKRELQYIDALYDIYIQMNAVNSV